MPNYRADPLTKITLNVFTADLAIFRQRYGSGYTQQIRRLVHQDVVEYKQYQRELDRLEQDSIQYITEADDAD